MKSKKSLSHGDLMKELFHQVKFPLDVCVINYVWEDHHCLQAAYLGNRYQKADRIVDG